MVGLDIIVHGVFVHVCVTVCVCVYMCAQRSYVQMPCSRLTSSRTHELSWKDPNLLCGLREDAPTLCFLSVGLKKGQLSRSVLVESSPTCLRASVPLYPDFPLLDSLPSLGHPPSPAVPGGGGLWQSVHLTLAKGLLLPYSWASLSPRVGWMCSEKGSLGWG